MGNETRYALFLPHINRIEGAWKRPRNEKTLIEMAIQFIARNNAVGEIYAKAGIHTPAGLQSATPVPPVPPVPETHPILIAPLALANEVYAGAYETNPIVLGEPYNDTQMCVYSDANHEFESVTVSIDNGDGVLVDGFEMYEIEDEQSEWNGKFVGEVMTDPVTEAGEHTMTVVFECADGTYTVEGTFTVENSDDEPLQSVQGVQGTESVQGLQGVQGVQGVEGLEGEPSENENQ